MTMWAVGAGPAPGRDGSGNADDTEAHAGEACRGQDPAAVEEIQVGQPDESGTVDGAQEGER